MSQNKTITLEKLWSALSVVLNDAFNLKPIERDAYMKHYNLVVSYFNSDDYHNRLITVPAKEPKSENTEDNQEEIIPPGGELYFNVKRFFKNYLENIAANGNNLQGENFFRFYAKTWERYQFSSRVANRILDTLNKVWVYRQPLNGVRGITTVFNMAMQIWHDVFFKEINQSLITMCIDLINDERNGKSIESNLVYLVIESYVNAGSIRSENGNANSQTRDESLAPYREYFEKPILEEMETFYQRESNEFLANNSMTDYIKKVHQRFAEEENRVRNVLHQTTMEKVQRLMTKILIQGQLEPMYIEARKLLRDDKIEDLRILFDLINRVDKADEPLQKDLEEYAYELGMERINAKKETASKDPKVYVETIIEVYEKFSAIVVQGFSNHHGFKVALDKAFSKIVNDNAVTRDANGSSKSSELFAQYCDALFPKGNKVGECDVKRKLDQIMVVFNYVEDKDIFQKYNDKMLDQRLSGQLSASNDYEESKISK